MVENHLDLSVIDEAEAERVSVFCNNSCGCKLGPKNFPCSSAIAKETGSTV